jgi:TolB-like protein/DNA-binding winged helix-turn-helix (wHTH) protein
MRLGQARRQDRAPICRRSFPDLSLMRPDTSVNPIDLSREADFRLGASRVRPSICQVEVDGRSDTLQPRVMQALVALAQAKGAVVSRDELIARCWRGAAVGEDAVTRVMGRIRRFVEENSQAGLELETIPRIGYRLIANGGGADASAHAEPPLEPQKARTDWIAAGILALLALVFLIPLLPRERAERVAVLSFDTLNQASLRPFADGLADQIIGVMSVSDLQVVPRGPIDFFRGAEAGAAAREAGAAFVLDGVVRREGEALRVNMHVVDMRERLTIWSYEYRRPAAEESFFQEQIAAHVADVLRCALISRRPNAGKIDPQTLSIFLSACDQLRRTDRGPAEMYEAARQVTERAPRFSRGWSMLAIASAFSSRSAEPEKAKELRDAARQAALRARVLDRTNAESYLALSLIAPRTGRFRERQGPLDQALALEPNSPQVHGLRGEFFADVGRMSDALGSYRRAAALDPLSPGNLGLLMPALSSTGHFVEMRAQRERFHRIWPDSPALWFNRFNNIVFVGEPEEALAILDAEEASPVVMEEPMRMAFRRYLLARLSRDAGDMREAASYIEALARRNRFDKPRAIAAISSFGQVDAAFSLARDYFDANPMVESFFLFVPSTEQMRRDRRFMTLARRVGLVEYWTETGHWPDFCSEPDLPYDCRAEAGARNM